MDKNQKNILVVFTDIYLPYSPTTLNIIKSFEQEGHIITVIASEPKSSFSDVKIAEINVKYLSDEYNYFSNLLFLFKRITFKLFSKSSSLLMSQKASAFIKEIRKHKKSSVVIAVDIFALWCVQKTGMNAYFLSLELPEKGIDKVAYEYFKKIKKDKILGVITQSDSRYRYLFENETIPYFILPNSPQKIDLEIAYKHNEVINLIYCGSAVNFFGIISILDFLTDYSEYKLTIQGAIPDDTKKVIELFYKNLITENRLILNNVYLKENELIEYISKFDVGFVFYDFYRFSEMRKFNYYTAPSGKLFNYFNAGIPVIANRLEGFEMVENENAGVLINNLSSVKIKNALEIIKKDYNTMALNSKKLSMVYDFNKHIRPIVEIINKGI